MERGRAVRKAPCAIKRPRLTLLPIYCATLDK